MPDKVLLSLVRYALGTQDAEETVRQCHVPDPSLWKEVYSLSRQQTVTGLMYQALSMLPAKMSVPEDIVLSLATKSARVEQRSVAIRKQAETMLNGLRRAGFSPVLMKGPAVAAFYPKPLLRESGDIDLFFSEAELPSALKLFREKGYRPVLTPDGSYFCEDRPASVDIHSRYFDLHVSKKDLPDIPSPEATLLMLSAHILKHAMGTGIGLRQICDMAMAYRALRGEYDCAAVVDVYKRTGLLRWNELLAGYIEARLGIPCPVAGESADLSRLDRVIFEGGDFGHYARGRRKKLGQNPVLRKIDTASRLFRKASFGIRYAPREYFCRLKELGTGNFAFGRKRKDSNV